MINNTTCICNISSERRIPILADVMAQLDYMKKRGSGLQSYLSIK